MDPIAVVLIVLVVVVLIAGAVVAVRARRRAQLRERFGPEYARAVEEGENVQAAEADLRARVEKRDSLTIRTLSAEEREHYNERWLEVQGQFVERPESAIVDADALVSELMHDRGYPVADFEQQANLISVDHPQVVAHYRDAHTVFARSGRDDEVSTEDLRQGLVSYRALFAELLEDETETTDEDHKREAVR
jgi:hypothetical protein